MINICRIRSKLLGFSTKFYWPKNSVGAFIFITVSFTWMRHNFDFVHFAHQLYWLSKKNFRFVNPNLLPPPTMMVNTGIFHSSLVHRQLRFSQWKANLKSGICGQESVLYGGRQQDQRSPEEGEGAPHTAKPETGPDKVITTYKKCIMLYNIRIPLMYGLY